MKSGWVVGAGFAVLALSLVVPLAAQAQAATKTLNGDAPAKGAMMSRDELRSCLKEQQVQTVRVAELEKRRAEIEAETDAVRQQKDTVQAERDAYAAKVAQVQAFKERVKAHGERVALYNQRTKEFKESPPVANAERERGQLEAEGDALAKADAAIKAEAAQWTGTMEPARVALTEHTQSQQAAAATAIEHNRVFNEEAKGYDEQLAAWKQRCGNRPYREADEKAIRAEK